MGKIARRTLDVAMTVLTLILMGGNGLFYNAFGESLDSGLIHENLGVALSAVRTRLHRHHGAVRDGDASF